MAGRLKRNLVSIRKFVGCAQSEAARLSRLYVGRFCKVRSRAGTDGASATCVVGNQLMPTRGAALAPV